MVNGKQEGSQTAAADILTLQTNIREWVAGLVIGLLSHVCVCVCGGCVCVWVWVGFGCGVCVCVMVCVCVCVMVCV